VRSACVRMFVSVNISASQGCLRPLHSVQTKCSPHHASSRILQRRAQCHLQRRAQCQQNRRWGKTTAASVEPRGQAIRSMCFATLSISHCWQALVGWLLPPVISFVWPNLFGRCVAGLRTLRRRLRRRLSRWRPQPWPRRPRGCRAWPSAPGPGCKRTT
jgi:hypothetical protein